MQLHPFWKELGSFEAFDCRRVKERAYQPYSNTSNPFSERPLVVNTEFEGVAADLYDVVEEGTEGCQGEGGGEQRHIAVLNEHLQVVIEGVLILSKYDKHYPITSYDI